MIISIIPVTVAIPKTNKVPDTTNNSNKYLIIKVDDVGEYLSTWKWFYDAVRNISGLNVDLGVIAKELHANKTHEEYFKNNIINNPQFGIFNHGWDHIIPEFQNRSYNYMYTHLAFWDYYMKTTFNYSPNVKVLGAPGNAIGNRSDCSLDLYTILAELNYKLVFFSKCQPESTGGTAGGNLVYIPFEESNLYPRTLTGILNDFTKMKNDQFLITQIHPSHHWNATYFNYIFDNVLSNTQRRTIHIQDYYQDFFLSNYPDYFLANSFNFLKTRSDANALTFNITEYENALNPPENPSNTSIISRNSQETSPISPIINYSTSTSSSNQLFIQRELRSFTTIPQTIPIDIIYIIILSSLSTIFYLRRVRKKK